MTKSCNEIVWTCNDHALIILTDTHQKQLKYILLKEKLCLYEDEFAYKINETWRYISTDVKHITSLFCTISILWFSPFLVSVLSLSCSQFFNLK